jgi:hypothetical protein
MTEPTASAPPTATSEETAEHGCVFAKGPRGDHMLSHADAWREGNTYVVRSTEFDVLAEDEDFGRAVDTFVTWLIDRAGLLAELVGAGEATEDEERRFAVLSARLFPLLHATEGQERRRHIRRRRTTTTARWRHQGTQASSSARLSRA